MWKQPKHPQAGKRISNMWYINIMQYHSAKKERTTNACNNIDQSEKICLLHERSQIQKITYYMIYMDFLGKTKL